MKFPQRNDATKAANRMQWQRVEDGLAPLVPAAVDCGGSDPGFDAPCYNKPAWVLEDYYGYNPTCHQHLGKVSLNLLTAYPEDNDTNFTVVFHRYRGD